MRISEEKNTVFKSDSFQQSKFTIETSAKAFQILSSNIYQNKIESIIRELSTNAYDAHIEAGKKDTPFFVNIPTWANLTFSIRDYGLGLTHEEIESIYTKYFFSDKSSSNRFVGALGLGSKSPFAYTSSFTVKSFDDGRLRIYNAFIDEDKTPSIALMGESDTVEPNGLEVSIPVQSSDVDRFKRYAEKVYLFFDVKPKINISLPKLNTEFSGPKWKLVNRVISGMSDSNLVSNLIGIMGNVCYPISGQNLNIKDYKVTELLNNLSYSNYKLILYFDIGDLEIEASREGLSYDDRTIKNITTKIGEFAKEVSKELCDKLDNLKAWDRYFLLEESNKLLTSAVDTDKYIKWKHRNYYGLALDKYNIQLKKYNSRKNIADVQTLLLTKKVKFIIDDLDKGTASRIAEYHKTHYLNYYIVENNQKEIDKLVDLLEFDPKEYLINASTLPAPPKKVRKPRNARKFDSYLWQPSAFYAHSVWKDYEVDTSVINGGYYVEVFRLHWVDINKKQQHFLQLRKIIELLATIQPLVKDVKLVPFDKMFNGTTPVYGIKTANLDKIAKDPAWINLPSVINTEVDKLCKSQQLQFAIGGQEILSSSKFSSNFAKLQLIAKHLDVNHSISKVVNEITEFNKQLNSLNETVKHVNHLLTLTNKTFTQVNNVNNLKKSLSSIKEKYKLLDCLFESFSYKDYVPVIKEYIQLVDQGK